MKVSEINVGDEIGGQTVVFTMCYRVRPDSSRAYNFITQNSKGKFMLHRSSDSEKLSETDIYGDSLKDCILELFKVMKSEIKLTHTFKLPSYGNRR